MLRILYRHQKQALTFMLTRERGWALQNSHGDIWKQNLGKDSQRRYDFGRELIHSLLMTRYVNNVTGDSQLHPPPNFRGGILADAMGLGKTLSMIALIASDILRDDDSSGIYCDAVESLRNYHHALKRRYLLFLYHVSERVPPNCRNLTHDVPKKLSKYGRDRNVNWPSPPLPEHTLILPDMSSLKL